jgi:hypothetical protein
MNRQTFMRSLAIGPAVLPLVMRSAAYADPDDHNRDHHGHHYAKGQPNHGTSERDRHRHDRDDKHRHDHDHDQHHH